MSVGYFAVLTINYILTATGYKLVLTSDVPCHLYMRWSTLKPWAHKKAVTERGYTFMGDVRYCFDVYHDNEQDEPGDTLTHTFVKEPWPGCETRYFYFHGTIAGNPTPSTTGLFKKHRPVEANYPYFIEPWTYIVVPPPDYALYFTERWSS